MAAWIDVLPALCVALPAAAALAIALAPRRWAEGLTLAAAALSAAGAASLAPAVLRGATPGIALFPLLPGVDFAFRVDPLGLLFGVLALTLWGLAGIYSAGYVRATTMDRPRRFFACYAASVAAAAGAAFSANVLTFLIFYELLTFATYPLVAHKETPEALAAARRYLAYALSAGLALTVAAVWAWSLAGTLDFRPGGFLAGRAEAGPRGLLFALFMAGCAVKAAIMPLHAWLPAAMVAPTPVSALLHAVAVVKAGVFGALRVLGDVFGPEGLAGTPCAAVLAAACGVTIVAASLAALGQDHLKRRLAYSTVAQLSYIVLGGALLTERGLTGSMVHLVNHGVAKITLFFAAGAVYAAAHAERIGDLKGLGRRMPWTFAAFSVATFGLIGVPGLCGFVGKFLLARGAVDADAGLALAVLLGGGVLTASYLLPILRTAWFDAPDPKSHAHEAPALMVAPLVATAALVVLLGAWPAALKLQHGLAARGAAAVFGGAP